MSLQVLPRSVPLIDALGPERWILPRSRPQARYVFGEYLLRDVSPMASVPSSEVEAGLRRRHALNGARAVARADDLRPVGAGVQPCLCRRRCDRRGRESESNHLDGEPLPALHLNSLSRVSWHVSTVRWAGLPVVRSRDTRRVKVLTERWSGSPSRPSPRGCAALLRHDELVEQEQAHVLLGPLDPGLQGCADDVERLDQREEEERRKPTATRDSGNPPKLVIATRPPAMAANFRLSS